MIVFMLTIRILTTVAVCSSDFCSCEMFLFFIFSIHFHNTYMSSFQKVQITLTKGICVKPYSMVVDLPCPAQCTHQVPRTLPCRRVVLLLRLWHLSNRWAGVWVASVIWVSTLRVRNTATFPLSSCKITTTTTNKKVKAQRRQKSDQYDGIQLVT